MAADDRPLVSAYLDRIGVASPAGATIDTLRQLHAAHVAAIPFENLDILLGRGISLDIDRLSAKLDDQRRGGYCFEQNTLFQRVLSDLGFAVTPMEARVRVGSTAVRPRTHMVLAVLVGEDQWLADVGFGAEGLLEPVPMDASGSDKEAADTRYRTVCEGPARVLQMRRADGWLDLYAFLPQPVPAVDFEVGNWYTSTHPASPFTRGLTAQRTTREVRYVLRYPTYTEIRGLDVRSREITRAELVPLLQDPFLIEMPVDVRFDVIDGRAAEPAG